MSNERQYELDDNKKVHLHLEHVSNILIFFMICCSRLLWENGANISFKNGFIYWGWTFVSLDRSTLKT